MTNLAWGYALVTYCENLGDRAVLDAWFPNPQLGKPNLEAANNLSARSELGKCETKCDIRQTFTKTELIEIDLETAPTTVPDAYLRLHLLSHRLVLPNSINLEGIFGVLPNNVWTNHGPCQVEGFELVRAKLRAKHGCVQVYGVDKFPRMTDYVVPKGVRIADADRVRLGAHLASGTTVMHEGFCNFNAGTLGTAMVEGRIVAGVVVDKDTDIGAGASIMGTLSGGGEHKVRIGQRCLLGANAGTGISLGDDCVVEAGLYLTAGTKVELQTAEGVRTIKAKELSGASGLLYIRNSISGAVQAKPREGKKVVLNDQLHKN